MHLVYMYLITLIEITILTTVSNWGMGFYPIKINMLHNTCGSGNTIQFSDNSHLFLQSSSPLQWQNRVHRSPLALQLHLLLEHGLLLQQPHLISLSRSAGARGVPWGTIVGRSIALPSGWYQPCSVGFRVGGSLVRQSRQIATAMWARRTFSLKAASVGGSEHSFGDSIEFRFILFFHTRNLASFREVQSLME